MDLGLPRRPAVVAVAAFGFFAGLPSALSMAFFQNQDWVWGVGLMLSGLFFALAARSFGIEKIRTEVANGEGADLLVGRWWTWIISFLIPLEAVILMVWWLWQARGWDPKGWLDPTEIFSVGTVLAQWAVAIAVLLALNKWLGARFAAAGPEETT